MPILAPSKSAAVTVVLVPSSSGSSSTSSAIRSCARWIAPASASSMSSGAGASRRRRMCTAVLLATSPRAAPPTPSAMMRRFSPAKPESWLSLRTRPTSDSAAYRRLRVINRALLPQLEDGLADADLRSELKSGGLRESLGTDVRAIGGAEILDEPLVPRRGNPGVPGRDIVVIETDRGVASPADQQRGVIEWDLLVGVGPFDDCYVGWCTPRTTRSLGGVPRCLLL